MRPSRRVLLGALVVALATVVGLTAYAAVDARRLRVTSVTLRHAELPPAFDGLRIVQLTDLHGARFGRRQERLLKAVRDARPDIVLLTGDYASDRTPDAEALAPLVELAEGLPETADAYYILGNWDAEGRLRGPAPAPSGPAADALEAAGVRPLYPGVRLARADQALYLTHWAYESFGSTEAMRAEVGALRSSGSGREIERRARYMELTHEFLADFDEATDFNVMVAHAPVALDYDAELERDRRLRAAAGVPELGSVWRLVDWRLAIAGHTHAGQIRLPFLGPLLTSNGDGRVHGALFPRSGDRYVYGAHDAGGGRTQWVGAGLGAGGPIPWMRFRLFNRPEVAVITLSRK